MKIYQWIGLAIVGLFTTSCGETKHTTQTTMSSAYHLVNPFIGTGGHGHTYPGATLPFGMVQLSPDTRLDGWDGCSGYHYTDSVVYGFSHTHLSGTGVSDYGDVLLMPFCHPAPLTLSDLSNHQISPSAFSKQTETAQPGYYAVHLDDHDIDVALTSTTRVGIHQYTFNTNKDKQVLLDLNHRDMLLSQAINIESNTSLSGHRVSKAWAVEQHLYFAIECSNPFEIYQPDTNQLYTILRFDDTVKTVIFKVGISAVSTEGAKANLKEEAKHWNFNQYLKEAEQKWETALTKIQVSDPDENKMRIFYSALYHTLIVPNVFTDVDGKYRGMDQAIHQSDTGDLFTIFSLWDTFRGAHPLYTIIEQDKTNAFIRTFLKHFEQGGRLPVWELSGNETDCMIGYHAVPVIADAYIKGIKDYDIELALKAMQHSANLDHLGLSAYKTKGYIAAGDESESVSKTLEYAYDDWCIAMVAKALGKDSLFQNFIQRGQYYKNIFNPDVGFMQSKLNGGWTTGFDPAEVNFNFTEANSWQYSLFAPQDIEGMIQLYGGPDAFEKKLDELFETEMELSGRHQVDITGLIGQYAHGNEPSHHMAYLYNYIGKPYKTQAKINQILTEQYQNAPDGLSGNEDCGQMSAWYVLSSMGFYSVTPGLDYYTIGTPHFESVKINLENGHVFSIQANHLSKDNIYIQSAMLNGQPYPYSFIKHNDIMHGGELSFEMGPNPNTSWGSLTANQPYAAIDKAHQITPVPYFSSAAQTFSDSLIVSISSLCNDCEIYYALNANEYQLFTTPIVLKANAKFKAYAIKSGQKSHTVSAEYIKIKGGRSIQLNTPYSNQYSGGGDQALIDYLKGAANFRTGYWQGFQGQSVEAIIDLGQTEAIRYISVGALQDIKSWIWFPKSVQISISNDGKNFTALVNLTNVFPNDKEGAFLKAFEHQLTKAVKAKYVKVNLEYPGDCPDWHLGNGGKSWLFIDEITIE